MLGSLLSFPWNWNRQKLPVCHTCHIVSLPLCLGSEAVCLGTLPSPVMISQVPTHGFKCSWLWHTTSPLAPDAKKTLKVKKVQKRAKNWLKMHKKVLQSAHIKRVSVSRMSVPILPSNRLMSARNVVKFWQTFVMSTPSNQFESHIFQSNFRKLVVAAQDYNILHSSHIPENPGWPKWTCSSPQIFKLSSGEPKVIQLVTWYHVLFLG